MRSQKLAPYNTKSAWSSRRKGEKQHWTIGPPTPTFYTVIGSYVLVSPLFPLMHMLNFVLYGANSHDLTDIFVRRHNDMEFDPEIERVYLKSGKPLVCALPTISSSRMFPHRCTWPKILLEHHRRTYRNSSMGKWTNIVYFCCYPLDMSSNGLNS